MEGGKYDDVCAGVRVLMKAEGAIVIIVGGSRGSGFSASITLDALRKMPKVLRDVAVQMEQQVKALDEFNAGLEEDLKSR